MASPIDRYRQMSVPARAAVWYVLCSVLQRGISFVVVPIYTRLLTTAEYGAYSVFQSWQGILIIFATLNLYAGVFTKAMVDYEGDRDRYSSSMQGLSTMLTALLFLVYLVSPSYWQERLSMGPTTIILMFLYFLTYPSLAFWSVRQRVENRYRAMVGVTLFVSMLTPAVSLSLLLLTDLRELAVIWGFLISQIAVGAFFYALILWRGRTFFVREYWAFALRYNIPLVPHYLSLIVLGQIDRIMLGDMRGASEAGIYTLGYQVSMAMNIVISGVNGSLVPWVYERLRDRHYDRVRSVSNALCLVVAVGTVAVTLIGPEVIAVLGSADYAEARWIIPAVTASVFFTFCYNYYTCIEFYYSKTVYVTVGSLASALFNVALNYVLIPRFGFVAAGYTTLASYALLLVMHWAFAQRICRELDVAKGAFDSRTIFTTCLAMVGAMFTCLALYRAAWLRYAAILALGVLGLSNARRIKAIVQEVRK